MKQLPSSHIASLDLETDENNRIYAIGAVVADTIFCKKNRFPLQDALKELDDFTQSSSFLLGHNLLQHDLPVLAQCTPNLALHQKPVIDTLFLSPLAFDDTDCQWCQQNHNPETQLHIYFGFPSFRAQPSTEDGKRNGI